MGKKEKNCFLELGHKGIAGSTVALAFGRPFTRHMHRCGPCLVPGYTGLSLDSVKQGTAGQESPSASTVGSAGKVPVTRYVDQCRLQQVTGRSVAKTLGRSLWGWNQVPGLFKVNS